MRPPGGPIVDMFNYAHDIDLYWEWANSSSTTASWSPTPASITSATWAANTTSLTSIRTRKSWMRSAIASSTTWRCRVFSLAMGDYAYMVRIAGSGGDAGRGRIYSGNVD